MAHMAEDRGLRLFEAFPFRINREGVRFIVVFAGFAVAAAYVLWPLGVALALVSLWCAWFFRDPKRQTPVRPGVVFSPADGRVQKVDQVLPPPELGMGNAPRTCIHIFMNIFNVHVNRVPIAGTIIDLHYWPGRFFNASFDKASEHNERQGVHMRTADGADLAFVQIAGLIARRIKCALNCGQSVRAGERFGIIRFGSRVDVYLPPDATPLVSAGEHTVAGETEIATLFGFEAGGGGASGQDQVE